MGRTWWVPPASALCVWPKHGSKNWDVLLIFNNSFSFSTILCCVWLWFLDLALQLQTWHSKRSAGTQRNSMTRCFFLGCTRLRGCSRGSVSKVRATCKRFLPHAKMLTIHSLHCSQVSVCVLFQVMRLPPKEGKGDKPVKVIFGLNKVGCLLYEVVAWERTSAMIKETVK